MWKMRRRLYNAISAVLIFCVCAYTFSRFSTEKVIPVQVPPSPPLFSSSTQDDGEKEAPLAETPPVTWKDSPVVKGGPESNPLPDAPSHPIPYLINKARREFEEARRRQSTTLDAAVEEYRRRYDMPPPPHFDKWYEFAKSNGVQLVDEFDVIHDLMTPFWGLQPKTIRSRAKEALGFNNGLLGIMIRDHQVAHVEGGPKWQQNATKGMMDKFIRYLPDMDLAFNAHDEPRVVVPHDDLERLVKKARERTLALSAKRRTELVNGFSARAPELDGGGPFEETKTTRFNVFGRQATWTHSRMSCPPDSPARILDDDERADDKSRYSIGELGFVFNTTFMTDVCLTPSLSSSYGFFDRANTYKVVHDLFPIFSQSKISSYGDIIYPSPWYWYNKVAYDELQDVSWAEKEDLLYWRGSTTGGYSRNGGWRRQHRQNFVKKMSAKGQASIMADGGGRGGGGGGWQVREVARGDYRHLVDIHFSHIGQCDPGDCEAQAQYFNVTGPVEQQDAWKYKYLLDMDGNAFSGRFYAFLQSRSLTFKQALFREWHEEWLKPWVHYVPLSLRGDEWLEAVRFFKESDRAGDAELMAEASREWAGKTVRKVDMEAWLFRLLLEYARVVDDNRANLGFDST